MLLRGPGIDLDLVWRRKIPGPGEHGNVYHKILTPARRRIIVTVGGVTCTTSD